jgi:hypothetical protein
MDNKKKPTEVGWNLKDVSNSVHDTICRLHLLFLYFNTPFSKSVDADPGYAIS